MSTVIDQNSIARILETKLSDGSHVYDVEILVDDDAGENTWRLFAAAVDQKHAVSCFDALKDAWEIATDRELE